MRPFNRHVERVFDPLPTAVSETRRAFFQPLAVR
jgi:hypothetical protein